MSGDLPRIYAARHGETEWSREHRHTGRSDLPLTARGESNARRLGRRLAGIAFQHVWTSPLQRARRTCELAGFGGQAENDPELMEMDYGQYEGLRTAEIRGRRPEWDIFRDGCPDGESVAEMVARADRVAQRLRCVERGNVLLFAHMHFLRFLAARWILLPGEEGRRLALNTASVSILGYEHRPGEPVLWLWNDDRHVEHDQ